ncbi:YchJ family protein [Motiliproteus sediminis]|uniref:YchJ family protein n=1 Tax=Motiliproteus sediminis TaxID=1468178 RepID=UPI001AEF953D|nr:YchJ family metal-binding protein [Motiliproteus sediminis]
MPRPPVSSACPCGSGQPFALCCRPLLHEKQQAATAEQLMRSRFCAFALGYFDYLIETHHRDFRQALSIEALQQQDQHTRWLALEVRDCDAGSPTDAAGEVHFVARYLEGDRLGELEERSAFVREQGRWYYTRGKPEFRALATLGRNSPCPCGSGKKYKRCHQQ